MDNSSSNHDPDELHKLVVEYGDSVFRLAMSIVRDVWLAEDVAQDTLMKAWLALPSFRGDSSIKSWIMKIAYNTSITVIRSRRALPTDPVDMPEEAEVDDSVEKRVSESMAMDDFTLALGDLDDLSKSIVVLRELEGLSYEEISSILKVPLPTVKTRLLRARRRLRVALKEWG